MRDFSQDHRWLSINTATVRRQRGVDWPLLGILDACAARGIRAVAPWRDQVAAAGLATTARAIESHGLALSGYCRGGMAEPRSCASGAGLGSGEELLEQGALFDPAHVDRNLCAGLR